MSSDIKRRVVEDGARSTELRNKIAGALKQSGAPPVEAQVAFLRGLMENRAEADKFMKNPKEYCLEHGIVLSPEVVQLVVHNVINDKGIDPGIIRRHGEKVAGHLVSLRSPGTRAAWPVAAAAAAAVVMAATAVVTMVVTLVRTKRPMDARVLAGLGPDGIRLPDGARLDVKGVGPAGLQGRGPR